MSTIQFEKVVVIIQLWFSDWPEWEPTPDAEYIGFIDFPAGLPIDIITDAVNTYGAAHAQNNGCSNENYYIQWEYYDAWKDHDDDAGQQPETSVSLDIQEW